MMIFGVYLLIRRRAVLRPVQARPGLFNIRYPLYESRATSDEFACWQTCGYFNTFSNKNQHKTAKKVVFLAALSAVEWDY